MRRSRSLTARRWSPSRASSCATGRCQAPRTSRARGRGTAFGGCGYATRTQTTCSSPRRAATPTQSASSPPSCRPPSTVLREATGCASARHCCAPLPGGGSCQRVLSEAQALRVTGCRARGTRYLPPSCFPCARPAAAAASAPAGPISATALAAPPLVDVRSTSLHGSYGSRVDLVVRLLLALRREASRTDDPASCKCVIFSRHEPLLRLMDAACAMNGVSAARFGTSGHQHSEVATFLTDPTMQALLLSAQRDASDSPSPRRAT